MAADILLTGANGQLGWEIQRRATARALAVQGFTHTALDIADAGAVQRMIEMRKPRAVVNAAAYTAVDKAESDADTAFAVNRDGPANLAAACARANIPLIHVSTDYVFDGQKSSAYVETDPVAPLGVYGASKLAGEQAVQSSGAKYVILRTAWVYGVHGNNFVKTMLRLGADRDTLRVVADQRGCPTFAADLAEAILTLVGRLGGSTVPDEAWGVFHCVGGGETNWCDFARAIFTEAAPRLDKVPRVEAITTADYPTPARRPANSVLETAKLKRVHGIALRPWPEALADCLRALPLTPAA